MILVTGSNGLIGRALLRVLKGNRYAVRAHTRVANEAAIYPAELSSLDQNLREKQGALSLRPSQHSAATNYALQHQSSSADSLSLVNYSSKNSSLRSSAVIETHADALPIVQHRQLDFLTATLEDFVELVDGCDTIIHTAALVHAEHRSAVEFDQLNVEATRKLIRAANIVGIDSFVLFSTSAVYGSCFENVCEQSDSLNAQTVYAQSKLAAETVLQTESKATRNIVLRPSLVFGEGDRGNMFALIRQINRGRYANISGNLARKSVIYSLDAAQAVHLCLEKLPAGNHLFNLSNPQSVGVNELAVLIAQCLERKAPLTVPPGIINTAAYMAELALGSRSPVTRARLNKLLSSTTLNVDSLVRNTGFAPCFSLAEALGAEIEWAKDSALV